MASGKDPPRQSEREKTHIRRHAGCVKPDGPQADSDLDSEHQADLERDAERAETDKSKLQTRKDLDASRDLWRADVGTSRAERQAERDRILSAEREIAD